MDDGYPPWQYLYKRRPNFCEECIRQAVRVQREPLGVIRSTPFRKSIDAEKVLAAELTANGFWHSVTNRRHPPLFRKGLNFEVDFFHPDFGVALEIEKGEINNIWKNICKFAESPVISHGVLLVPVLRCGLNTTSEFYQNTLKRLGHLERIFAFIDSLLIIGY